MVCIVDFIRDRCALSEELLPFVELLATAKSTPHHCEDCRFDPFGFSALDEEISFLLVVIEIAIKLPGANSFFPIMGAVSAELDRPESAPYAVSSDELVDASLDVGTIVTRASDATLAVQRFFDVSGDYGSLFSQCLTATLHHVGGFLVVGADFPDDHGLFLPRGQVSSDGYFTRQGRIYAVRDLAGILDTRDLQEIYRHPADDIVSDRIAYLLLTGERGTIDGGYCWLALFHPVIWKELVRNYPPYLLVVRLAYLAFWRHPRRFIAQGIYQPGSLTRPGHVVPREGSPFHGSFTLMLGAVSQIGMFISIGLRLLGFFIGGLNFYSISYGALSLSALLAGYILGRVVVR